jgi:hypothetical protein
MEVSIEHIGLDPSIGDVNFVRQIDAMKSWNENSEMIINSIADYLKDLLFLYKHTCIIKIIDTDGREYILDDDYIRIKQPFSTNSDNSKIRKLKVIWIPVKNTCRTQLSGM